MTTAPPGDRRRPTTVMTMPAPTGAATGPLADLDRLANQPARLIDAVRQKSRPGKEGDLHDSQRETGLEHRADLVHIAGQRVPALSTSRSKWSQGLPDPWIAGLRIPVWTAPVGDEAEFVHARDQGTHDTQVDEADKRGRCLCRVVTDRRVQAPEDGDRADNERDENVHGRNDSGIEISIDEVGLYLYIPISIPCAQLASGERELYHHARDGNQEDQLG